ncbi:MAG: hypothetical protein WA642_02005 [Steroidobacteraceae bacterium]
MKDGPGEFTVGEGTLPGVGLATEAGVGVEEGLKHPSVINCDQLTLSDANAINCVGRRPELSDPVRH